MEKEDLSYNDVIFAIYAAKNDNRKMLEWLFFNCPKLTLYQDGILNVAAFKGQKDCTIFLLNHGASPESLHNTSSYSSYPEIKYLLWRKDWPYAYKNIKQDLNALQDRLSHLKDIELNEYLELPGVIEVLINCKGKCEHELVQIKSSPGPLALDDKINVQMLEKYIDELERFVKDIRADYRNYSHNEYEGLSFEDWAVERTIEEAEVFTVGNNSKLLEGSLEEA